MLTENLGEHIVLRTVRTDKFKSDFLSVSFEQPLERGEAAMNALILRILKRGTKNYPDMIALSKKLDSLYSADIFTDARSFGETQMLNFSLDALNNDYALDDTDIPTEGAKLLAEIIYNPVTENGGFKQSYFESEKRNQLADIDAEINNKAKYALSRLRTLMFEHERYGASALGTREEVEALTNAELYAHYQKLLTTSAMNIIYVGNADAEKLHTALAPILAGYHPGEVVRSTTEVVRRSSIHRYLNEKCVGKQGNLIMGFRTGTVLADGDYPKMALLNELLGGSATSMLFMNVREKLSLCYYCSSFVEAVKGVLFVRAGIDNSNYQAARDEILRQISMIRLGKFTNEELNAAKMSLINAYKEIADQPQALQNWYTGRALSGIEQTPAEAIAAVRSVTREDIVATLKKISLDTVYFLEGVPEGGND